MTYEWFKAKTFKYFNPLLRKFQLDLTFDTFSDSGEMKILQTFPLNIKITLPLYFMPDTSLQYGN